MLDVQMHSQLRVAIGKQLLIHDQVLSSRQYNARIKITYLL